ncbi:MAG: hypothetical protein AAFV95_12060 [Bacteroidota bacterium]
MNRPFHFLLLLLCITMASPQMSFGVAVASFQKQALVVERSRSNGANRVGKVKKWKKSQGHKQWKLFLKGKRLLKSKGLNGKMRVGLLLLAIGLAAVLSSIWVGLGVFRIISATTALLGFTLLVLGLLDQ